MDRDHFFHDSLPLPASSGLSACSGHDLAAVSWSSLALSKAMERFCYSYKQTGVQSCTQTPFLFRGSLIRKPVSVWSNNFIFGADVGVGVWHSPRSPAHRRGAESHSFENQPCKRKCKSSG